MAERVRGTRAPKTLAQWYCLLIGATLLLVGILGFIADTGFETGTDIEGDNFLWFEVNGWHNLVHLASGLVLLAAANLRPTAKTVAIGFGFVYGLVTIWGFIDGNTVFGIIPVNTADNLLHLGLAVLGIATGMVSPTTKREQLRRHEGDPAKTRRAPEAGTDRQIDEPTPAVRRDAAAGTERTGRFTGEGRSGDVASDNEIRRTRS